MNLTEVFQQEGKVVTLQVPLEGNVEFEYKWNENPIITLEFKNLEKGKALVTGSGRVSFSLPCDRCLKTVEETVFLDFERELYGPDISIDEDTREEQYYLEGYQLDVALVIKEALLMYWPTKILCKDDCKGICKKCGVDLNQASCDCDDFVPDVRFANLMDIFNNSQ